MNRWREVRQWRDRLRNLDPSAFDTGLSPAGAGAAWNAALEALSDEALERAAEAPGVPWSSATFIAARTVFTAPIEWLALLLGHGTAVRWKSAAGARVSAQAIAAAAEDLPLTLQQDRSLSGEVIFAMGSDPTIAEIQASLPANTTFFGFGSRYSAAWIEGAWDAIAEDAAFYDGRGCFSPGVVFSSAPDAAEQLAAAMTSAQNRLPVGEISDAEHAAIRARRALAKVTGKVFEGEGWSVHQLPAERWTPAALPRSIALVSCAPDELPQLLRRFPGLSTLGTERTIAFAGIRQCLPGQMQKPAVNRVHDGIFLPAAVLRPNK